MRIILALAVATAALTVPCRAAWAEPSPGVIEVAELRAGDVLVQQDGASWAALKILAVEVAPDGSRTAHVLLYRLSPTKPTLAATRMLEPLIRHAPLDALSLTQGYERLGNLPPSEEELEGYRFYQQGFE